MDVTKDVFAQTKATGWFRTLERQLGELLHLENRTRLAMPALEAEFRKTVPRSQYTFHVKHRAGNLLPDSIHRVRLCGTSRKPIQTLLPFSGPRRRWVQHLKGPPSREELYFGVKDVRLHDLYKAFDTRANCLNAARHALVLGREAIAHRAMSWAEPRDWEAGDLSLPAPLLQWNGLPHHSIRALASVWPLFLRIAAVHFELSALAARHNADPPHRGLRLSFRTDGEHPFGRFLWTLRGQRLSRLARSFGKWSRDRRVDDSNLPDRLLRQLKIPAPVRKAICPHERHRRRMARIYRSYVDLLTLLLGSGPRRMKEARDLLRRAGVPETVRASMSSV